MVAAPSGILDISGHSKFTVELQHLIGLLQGFFQIRPVLHTSPLALQQYFFRDVNICHYIAHCSIGTLHVGSQGNFSA